MIEINSLSLKLGSKKVLSDISVKLEKGSLTALIGKNGSGKTSLIRCLNGSVRYSGNIFYRSRDLRTLSVKAISQRIATLWQNRPSCSLTPLTLAKMGRSPYLDLRQHLSDEDTAAVNKALEVCDLFDLQDQSLDTLSGGERQRAYWAMLLSQDCPVMLLDEPLSHLDTHWQRKLSAHLKRLCKAQNKTALLIHHDLSLVCEIADRIVILDNGACLFSGTTEECLEKKLIERTFSVQRFISDKNNRIFFS